ncbi:MAG: addiction module protein [Phycisphaeraceae bacterium]
MSDEAARLLNEVLALPEKDRAFFAGRLLESLHEGEDEGVDEAWDAEIARRVEEVKSGKVKGIPRAEARRIISGEVKRRGD